MSALPALPSLSLVHKAQFWLLERLRQPVLINAVQPALDRREKAIIRLLADGRAHLPTPQPPVPGRVVFAIGSLGIGGAERQAVYNADAIRRVAGAEVVVLTETLLRETVQSDGAGMEHASFFVEPLRRLGIEARAVRPNAEGRDAWVARNRAALFPLAPDIIALIWSAYLELRQLRPQVVFAALDRINIAFGIAAVLAGVPRVVLVGRSVGPRHFPLFQWYMFPAYRALAAEPSVTLLNNSAAGAADYAAWLGLPLERIGVLRNVLEAAGKAPPADAERAAARARFGVAGGGPVLGGVFRFGEEKRPDLWLETALTVAKAHSEVRFLLCGDGPLRGEIMARAAASPYAGRFVFAGAVRDMPAAYAAMDVLLLTSRMEGLPNVLLEAQAAGVAVIATDVGGSAEAIGKDSGWAVATASAPVLAAPVLAVLNDPDFLVRARIAGPEFVARHFSLIRLERDIAALFQGFEDHACGTLSSLGEGAAGQRNTNSSQPEPSRPRLSGSRKDLTSVPPRPAMKETVS